MFMSELRRLSKTCNFRDSLDSMLRDRLVCGVNDDHIQRRLLQEKDLQLDRAMEIALSLEVAAKNCSCYIKSQVCLLVTFTK